MWEIEISDSCANAENSSFNSDLTLEAIMMFSKRAAMLLIGLFAEGANCQSGQPSAVELLTGTWQAYSVGYSEQVMIVQRDNLDTGDCSHIRYKFIRDQPGYGHGPENRRSGHVWRTIAVELIPSNAEQAQCLERKVLEFSIPSDAQTRADIGFFKTRTDFEKNSEPSGWGVWIKVR